MRILIFCMFGLLLINKVAAWDNQGHRIIALLGGYYVNDRTAKFLEKNLYGTQNSLPERLAYVSIQADMKQNDTSYAWASPMHYAYTDYKCSPYVEKRDCPNGVCIVTAIAKFSSIASDPKASLEERKEALMFLIHFMGDIHQPLHIGFWKDDGGSKLWLMDPPTHLHDVWDSVIVSRYIKRLAPKNLHRKWNYYTLADDLLQELDTPSINAEVEGIVSKIPVPMNSLDYKSMNDFAAAIASETTGQYTCKLAYRNENGQWIQYDDVLTKTYLDDRWKIVKRQYMVAGYRLALVLDLIAETFAQKANAIRLAAVKPARAVVPVARSRSNRFADLMVAESSGTDSETNSSDESDTDDRKKLKQKQEEEMEKQKILDNKRALLKESGDDDSLGPVRKIKTITGSNNKPKKNDSPTTKGKNVQKY